MGVLFIHSFIVLPIHASPCALHRSSFLVVDDVMRLLPLCLPLSTIVVNCITAIILLISMMRCVRMCKRESFCFGVGVFY